MRRPTQNFDIHDFASKSQIWVLFIHLAWKQKLYPIKESNLAWKNTAWKQVFYNLIALCLKYLGLKLCYETYLEWLQFSALHDYQ